MSRAAYCVALTCLVTLASTSVAHAISAQQVCERNGGIWQGSGPNEGNCIGAQTTAGKGGSTRHNSSRSNIGMAKPGDTSGPAGAGHATAGHKTVEELNARSDAANQPSAAASRKGYISGKGGDGIARPGSDDVCAQGVGRAGGHTDEATATTKGGSVGGDVQKADSHCDNQKANEVGIKEEGVK